LAVAEKNRVLLVDDEPDVVYLVKKSLANVKDKFYNSPDKFLFISIPEMTRQIKQFFG
jgi:CheY-like chemotaxis protein